MNSRFSSMPLKINLSLVLLLACLSGCTTVHHLNTPEFIPEYAKKQNPFPLTVALSVPEETQKYAFTIPTVRWEVGEAVSSHMASGLQAVFKDVAVIKDGKPVAGADLTAVCSLGKQTEYQRGMFVSSDQTFVVQLECRVLDQSKKTLWEGTVLHTNVYNAGMAAKMLMATSAASIFIKSVDPSSAQQGYQESLAVGMNDTLLVAVDQMMARLVGEGKSRICPDCTSYPEWHKPLGKQP
ncbi:MAG: hypothetical protein FIA91_13195 [Geobacter sp.]|nr:hypothetical protein [Geobacter sp.]